MRNLQPLDDEGLALQRLLKSPKYKIGDIVVYPDRYYEPDKGGMMSTYQSKIISSSSLIELLDEEDTLSWYYETEHTREEQEDTLEENDIFYKL